LSALSNELQEIEALYEEKSDRYLELLELYEEIIGS
jgi:hypothetical protein